MSTHDDQHVTWRTFWHAYRATLLPEQRPPADPPEAWHFCDNASDADALAALVVAGTKTATASLYWMYEHEAERLPQPGDLSIIITWDGAPQCVIETTDVAILPFDQVGAEHAFLEGEGDRSLEYWRRVHWEFFAKECAAIGRAPTGDMPVVCERFRVLYLPR